MCNRDNDRCCNDDRCCNNCIAEILQVICVLQANACPNTCLNSCDRPALGGNNCVVFNTRPIMLFTCGSNGTPFSMPVSRTNTSCNFDNEKSCVFRIEKIDGCCATFRVLVPSTESVTSTFAATDSIFTIDINCICAIRCLNDTFVDCL